MVADGYKDTEIGVIPIEWEAIELGDIATFSKGKGISKKDISKDGVECIRYGELFTTYNEIIRTIKSKTNSTTNMMYSKVNDTLMPTSDVTPNGLATASALNKEGVILGGDILIIRSNDILSSYLSYFIRSHKKQIMKLVSGSTVYHIYANDMKKLKIPLPPLKEQEKIADILSTADEKIDAIDLQIKKAETLKKGLLQKLLSEGLGHSEFKDSELGKIPESWEVVRIVEILDLMTDYVANGSFASLRKNTTVYDSKEYAYYVRLFDLRKGLGHTTQKYVDKETYDFLDKSSLKGNEILIANIGANVGESFLMPILDMPSTLAPNMIELKLNYEKMIPLFCFNYLKSGTGLSELDKVIEGSGQPKINKTKLKTIKIPLPPLKEQKQIAEILSTVDEKLEVLRTKKDKYETLKKGLLQKLLSGEIRV